MATELGLHIADSWPDGVWMVELAALSSEAPLAGTVASTLGLSLAGRDPQNAIVADLAGHSAVIIFDNCEHLVEAIADLVDLLRKRVPTLALSLPLVSRSVFPVSAFGGFDHRPS